MDSFEHRIWHHQNPSRKHAQVYNTGNPEGQEAEWAGVTTKTFLAGGPGTYDELAIASRNKEDSHCLNLIAEAAASISQEHRIWSLTSWVLIFCIKKY